MSSVKSVLELTTLPSSHVSRFRAVDGTEPHPPKRRPTTGTAQGRPPRGPAPGTRCATQTVRRQATPATARYPQGLWRTDDPMWNTPGAMCTGCSHTCGEHREGIGQTRSDLRKRGDADVDRRKSAPSFAVPDMATYHPVGRDRNTGPAIGLHRNGLVAHSPNGLVLVRDKPPS